MTTVLADTRRYPVQVHDNHLIAEIDGFSALLDTGADQSVSHTVREFDFLGRTIRPSRHFMGVDLETISEFVGCSIDILLGLDCLASCYWRLEDLESENPQLVTSKSPCLISLPSSLSTQTHPLLGPVPIIPVEIEGIRCQAFLDTGAKLGYVDISDENIFEQIGQRPSRPAFDFWPLIGQFETRLRDVEVAVADIQVNLPLGELPEEAGLLCGLLGVKVILGVDVLRQLAVEFALPDGRIHFGPVAMEVE
jgi:hypothetical protein